MRESGARGPGLEFQRSRERNELGEERELSDLCQAQVKGPIKSEASPATKDSK